MIVSGRDCFGCGACAAFCPHEAISMQRNHAGFLTPVLQETRCTQCGFCSRICPLEWAPRFQTPLAAYAGWSRDDAVRRRCSSGGIACELSRLLLARGFRVCAVAYSPETRIARHELAGSPEELAAILRFQVSAEPYGCRLSAIKGSRTFPGCRHAMSDRRTSVVPPGEKKRRGFHSG